MGKIDSTNNIDLSAPFVVSQDETGKLRIMLYGSGATLAGLDVYVIDPLGSSLEITSYFQEVAVPFTFLTLFEASYTFAAVGKFTFLIHNTATGDVFIESTSVAEWTTTISDLGDNISKLRTDQQRTFGRINRRN